MADTCELPLSRVKTIMKSSPDVNCISQEALFLAGKATVNTLRCKLCTQFFSLCDSHI